MNPTRNLLFIALALSIQQTTLHAQSAGPKGLDWLIGTWETEQNGMRISETWDVANDSTLTGHSETVLNSKVLFAEKLLLEYRESAFRYVAILPSKTAVFNVESIGDKSISFTDPTNNFPSRIIYQLKGEQLVITLEGSDETETMTMLKK